MVLNAARGTRHESASSHAIHKHRHSRAHTDQRRSRSASPSHALVRLPRPQSYVSDEPSTSYVVDKRGDPLIQKYGANERGKVPIYRRFGHGKLLGSPRQRFDLQWEGSRQTFTLASRVRDGGSVFRDKSFMRKVLQSKPNRLGSGLGRELDDEDASDTDFIAVERSSKRRKRSHSTNGDESTGEDSDVDYRSLAGKAKAADFDTSVPKADAFDEPVGVAGSLALHPLRQCSITLNRKVKEHPEDIDAWLQLVKLQDSLLSLDAVYNSVQSEERRSGVAAVRLALLEEALPHATGANRDQLLLSIMHNGSQVWSRKKLATKWFDLKPLQANFTMWKAYADYAMLDVKPFTFEYSRDIYVDRLDYLRQQLEKQNAEHDEPAAIEIVHQLIYVFLRLTRFIQEAGYKELSTAAWQALLEMTFARPGYDCSKQDSETWNDLATFWDSEVLRIGEVGAKGWRSWDTSAEAAEFECAAYADTGSGVEDVYSAWAALERSRAATTGGMPMRMGALDDLEDEDSMDDTSSRIIMFKAIRPLLFFIPGVVLSDVQSMVYDAFLLYCGLPAASGISNNWIEQAQEDPLIVQVSIDLIGKKDSQDDNIVSNRDAHFTNQQAHRMAIAPQVLFPTKDWFSILPTPTPLFKLAQRVSQQLATQFSFQPAALHTLALTQRLDPAGTKKAAKALLKNFRTDATLYNALAMTEYSNGDFSSAGNIYEACMAQTGLQEKDQLRNHWTWMELQQGNREASLCRILASTEESPFTAWSTRPESSPAQILRTRQFIQTRKEYSLSSSHLSAAARYAESEMLLQYLTIPPSEDSEPMSSSQGNITAAMAPIDLFLTDASSHNSITTSSPAIERLLQSAAKLLYQHTKTGPFRPPFIQAQLKRFATIFPRNTMFLSMYAWATAYSNILPITDPVRHFLREIVFSENSDFDCVSTRAFAISHEVHSRGASVHSVRTVFEDALASDACRGSAGLWLDYVRFCIARASDGAVATGEGAWAKKVFYRAVAACPWSKELVLEAFICLKEYMDNGELEGVYKGMLDSGLAIHVELDGFVARWKQRAGGR